MLLDNELKLMMSLICVQHNANIVWAIPWDNVTSIWWKTASVFIDDIDRWMSDCKCHICIAYMYGDLKPN